LNDLVSLKQLGETILLKILREGKMHEFNITLKPVSHINYCESINHWDHILLVKING